MSSPSSSHSRPIITVLPFEILSEISSYLDKKSLKSLRLASPNAGAISAAAFSILFESFSLRFRDPEYTPAQIRKIHLACDSLAAGSDHININGCKISNPLSVVKSLVVDTSRPYCGQTDHDYWQYHTASFKKRSVLWSPEQTEGWFDTHYNWYKQFYGPKYYDAFNGLLERVLSTVKGLRHVRWHTSNAFGLFGHKNVAKILCPPACDGRYTLDVTLAIESIEKHDWTPRFDSIDAIDHLRCLSGLASLTLRTAKHHEIAQLRLKQSLIDLASRCKKLHIPSMDTDNYIRLPNFSTPLLSLWDASDPPLETLEILASNHRRTSTGSSWAMLKSGTTLTIVVDLFGYDLNKYPRDHIFQYIKRPEAQLKRLKLNVYPPNLIKCLPETTTGFLTDIEINLKGQTRPDLASVGTEFWKDVVGAHSPTLKSIRVFVDWQGGWHFAGRRDNPARLGIEKCKRLEELRIGFIEEGSNYIKSLIDCVLRSCPKFHLLEMGFPYGYKDNQEHNIKNTALLLDWWESTENRFRNRVLEVRNKILFEDFGIENRFKAKLVEYPKLIWFDYLLQTWLLKENFGGDGEAVVKLKRVDDEYIYCDMLDDRSIEGPLKYMY
ncbi:hypothetical protein TWF718_001886 [Orbilia javanica]|uniref:F-box domain-containing protein n=1 Tax=Orbilia javanica TaxID=47235 RepID=A0AAN8MZK5_9PEZI